tara:strand:- start:1080 stop:2276 length:1197 start_codon:yes stop_codon:yes gene_type:complete
MVNYDILFAVIFYAILFLYYITHKEKFEVQGKIFVMYKTQLGIKLMDKIANFSPRVLNFLGGAGILVGYLGMFGIFFILIKGTIDLLTVENAVPVIAPVLPGVDIPGLPSLGFWHWIIAILIVATIHEFSHGILARVHKVKVNSSGFAFLGPILAAFVEPDEKEMEKSSKYKQLSVFAAGPWSNILTAFVFLLVSLVVFIPLTSSMMEFGGVEINSVNEGGPSFGILEKGMVINSINGIEVLNSNDFLGYLKGTGPGDELILGVVDGGDATVVLGEHPDDSSRGYMGVVSTTSAALTMEAQEKYGSFWISFIFWFARLFEWLFLISIGIGLANLLPLGPVDGGRMALTGLSFFIKNEKKLYKTWMAITVFTLALIVINLLPYFIQLFNFIFGPIIALI